MSIIFYFRFVYLSKPLLGSARLSQDRRANYAVIHSQTLPRIMQVVYP